MSQGPIVTRFAPSPTGHLHIGGARSALFCWAFAKRAELEHQARGGRPGDGGGGGGGRFMIRIEDTDQARSSEESARGILADLQWLGILNDLGPYIASDGTIREHDWPGGRPGSSPYFQAKRVPIYNAYIESLIKSGRAYPAFETSETLDAKRRASIAQKQTYRYDRAEYHRLATPEQRLDAMRESDAHRGFANLPWSGPKPETLNPKPETRPYVIRFAMDADPVIVHDQVLGDVKTAAGEVDDFVIRKADGFPTYHFAVVIDDELMGVTHILRAQEHLANTPRHVAMQRALSRLPEHGGPAPFRTPIYAHMPLIFNMDGTKMSKRDKAKVARAALRRFEAVFSEDEMFARFERVWLETKDAPDHDFSSLDKTVTFGQFREGKDEFRDGRNDSPFWAWVVSRMLDIQLPEIEVSDFRAAGYLPEAITNFIALLGWNPGMKLPDGKDLEKFDMDFLAKHFAIDRIGKTNAKFDRAKLLSFNADYIGKLSDADFAARWRSFLAEYEPNILAALNRGSGASPGTPTPTIDARFALLSSVLKPRAKTLRDAITSARFAIVADTGYDFDPKALEKLRPRLRAELLTAARTALAAQPDASWTPSAIHAALETLAKDLNLGIHNAAVGKLAQPLRIAVTGTGVSPGIAETLAILGKNSTLARIDRCLAFLS